MLLSAVSLLSPVSTLAVNSPVSAQESIFLKAYSHSNGSWVQSNGCWWYKHSNGSYTRNGWEKINGTWYYFDSKGWMKTGRHNIGDDTYSFASSGARQTINRRALVLGETSTRAVPIEDVNAMEKVFSNQNFSKVVRFPDKTKAEIIAKMQELFESSSESDVNYLYLTCHGGEDGTIAIGSDGQTFSGWELASILKQYKGKFVVMLDCCYSGTIIDVGKLDEKVASKSEERFDEQAFLAGFSTGYLASKNGEMLDSKSLVLCASWKGEKSYSAVGIGSLATRYWTMDTGWDSLQNRMISPMADTNTNGKITLEELYQYSYPLVLEAASQIHEEQHVSVYPENSQFVLFQK